MNWCELLDTLVNLSLVAYCHHMRVSPAQYETSMEDA